jgi:hypothetical protein
VLFNFSAFQCFMISAFLRRMDRGYSSQLGALLTGGGYLVLTRYRLLVTRHGGWGPLLPTRYQLPATRHGGFAALLLAVDLSPHRQHDIAEDKGIQGDEGDVAAEVEGEHAADEEEEHAAGFLIHWFSQPSSSFGAASRQSFFDLPQGRDSPFEVLPGEDRDPQRHQERFGVNAEEWQRISPPAASTPKNGPKFTTPWPIIPDEIVAPTLALLQAIV